MDGEKIRLIERLTAVVREDDQGRVHVVVDKGGRKISLGSVSGSCFYEDPEFALAALERIRFKGRTFNAQHTAHYPV